MAISYVEKGIWLHDAIAGAGHWMVDSGGTWKSSDDAAVQQIIDNFDPLPHARADAIARVKSAATQARERYATAGKDLIYSLKREQALAYQAAGYPADVTPYPLVEAEAAASGSTAQIAADSIIATASQWMLLAVKIEQAERTAVIDIAAEQDWRQCMAIADAAVSDLGAI